MVVTIQHNTNSFVSNDSIYYYSLVGAQFKSETLLFDSWIRPFQVLTLQAKVDLGEMVLKEYFAFPKAQALLETYHQIFFFCGVLVV